MKVEVRCWMHASYYLQKDACGNYLPLCKDFKFDGEDIAFEEAIAILLDHGIAEIPSGPIHPIVWLDMPGLFKAVPDIGGVKERILNLSEVFKAHEN